MRRGDDRLDDRIARFEVLGEGSTGRVWLAERRDRPGQLLALKEQLPDRPEAVRHEGAFRAEFATLARLRHPSLPEVREFEVAPGSGLARFTLEYVAGATFRETVLHEGPAALPGLAVEALRALAFLHGQGFVHGDLKPENVLIRRAPKLSRRVVLLDLGFVARLGPTQPSPPPRGTIPYMAPELFRNEPATARSDLYALGATLHAALYGFPPVEWRGEDLGAFLRRVSQGDRRRLVVPEGCPPGLPMWIEQLLSVPPDERPSSAREALARLDEACGSRTAADTPVDRAARLLSGRPDERAEELDRLESWLADSHGARVAFLCGPEGAGKSRLLRWIESEAILRGFEVVAAPVAEGAKTLAVLDDADAIPTSTASVLERWAWTGSPDSGRLLAALRPGGSIPAPLRRLLESAQAALRIDLGHLDATRLRAMIRRATGEEPSSERVRWLLETTGGSAAFAEALLIDGTWERRDATPRGVTALAPPLGRVAVLSPATRIWMEWLCVTRGGLSEDLLAELAEMGPAEARAAVEEASAAGLLLRRAARVLPESRAVVERVLSSIEPERRRAAHRRAADLLASRPEGEELTWLLAQLHAESGRGELASQTALRAALEAERSGDPGEAANRFRFATLAAGRNRRARFEARMHEGRTSASAGWNDAAARAFGAAARLARGQEVEGDARVQQADALARAGRFERALEAAAEAERGAQGADGVRVRALARKVRGVVLARLGREIEALPVLQEASELLRGDDFRTARAETLHAIAACKLRLGRDDAEGDFRAALDAYARAKDAGFAPPEGADLKAALGLAMIRVRAGRPEEAERILEGVRCEAAAAGHLHLEEAALSRLAAVAVDGCRLDRAVRLAEQAADLARRLGDSNLVLVDGARLADAWIRCGRPGEALARLRELLDGSLDQAEPDNVDYARMLLAHAWLESGAFATDAPRRLLEECLEGCRRRRKPRIWAMALVFEMERRAAPGCSDPVAPILREFEAVVAGSAEPMDAEIVARAALARAADALERGKLAEAEGAARDAERTASDAGFLAYAARAAALLAEALERTGRGREAESAREAGAKRLGEAAARIENGAIREGFLARRVYAPLRRERPQPAGGEEGRLAALYEMIRALNSETDADALVESILELALRAVHATRGMILLRDERGDDPAAPFGVRFARNLETETLADAESYSRSIVDAAQAGESLLVLDAGRDERFRDVRSVSLFGIRSLMCVPLRSRGRIVGTVYLDGREEGRLFTPDDLRFVEAFADHAALALENVRVRARLERRAQELQVAAETRTEYANLLGRSPAMQKVFDLLERVAATDLPVLILGESGTGKELVARAIHFRGPRRRRVFLSENCAALPESLLESELFGHVRGAFTGAERARPGLFEQADGGTLFLDEVGDMSPAMQARLLRVLEDGEVRRIGAERTVHVRVRVLAATNKDLRREVAAGRFREDLFYRLQVLTLELPALRERGGDIPLLARRFADAFAEERGRPPVRIEDDVLDLLERHRWPGNARELQNTIRRLSVMAGGGPITVGTVGSDPVLAPVLLPSDRDGKAHSLTLESGEREQIVRALRASGGSRIAAARLLGVSRATLYRKLAAHGIR
jgi:transcriptional regulator with GAF, ATPase, and Fis domain/tetratricopeptide (TPR) repeat protein